MALLRDRNCMILLNRIGNRELETRIQLDGTELAKSKFEVAESNWPNRHVHYLINNFLSGFP